MNNSIRKNPYRPCDRCGWETTYADLCSPCWDRKEDRKMRRILHRIDGFLFRNGTRNNSPRWAFMEGFRVPTPDGSKDYLWRLRIVQTPLGGIYLHKLCGPDERALLHNHPFAFVSFILRGGYTEFVPGPFYAQSRRVKRVNVKPFNNSFHWIAELDRTPTWTLVFVGRRRRIWGYVDRNGSFTDFDKKDLLEDAVMA